MDIILDIKVLIASVDEEVWIKLYLYDDDFYEYACTNNGIRKFIDNFTYYVNNKTFLFDKLHSIYDKPAYTSKNGTKYWYYNGRVHRDDDLPAIICTNGTKKWYYNGLVHRDDDLPAIIYGSGGKEWLRYGVLYRENNLPVIIYSSGNKYYCDNGLLYMSNKHKN